MSRIFTLLLFIALFGNVSAQSFWPWIPFTNQYSYYRCLDDLTAQNPNIKLSKDEIIGFSTQFYPISELQSSRMVACDSRDANHPCETECSKLFAINGGRLDGLLQGIRTWNLDSDEVYLPWARDSLVTILTSESITYFAERISLSDSLIFGKVDSIAVFKIVAVDSIDTLFNDPWHNREFIQSKNFGQIVFPSWSLFPKHQVWFSALSVLSNGQLGEFPFSFNSMHNWNVGTIIQYEQTKSIHEYQIGILSESKINKQCTIASVDSIAFDVSFNATCKSRAQNIEYQQNNFGGHEEINNITVFEVENDTFGISTGLFFMTKKPVNAPTPSHLPREPVNYTTYQLNEQNQIEIKYRNQGEILSGDTCLIIDTPFEPRTFFTYDAIFGMGSTYWGYSEIEDFMLGADILTETFRLTYFKSDSIEYGTPGWPIGINEISPEKEVLIYPNPVENVLHLQHSESVLAAKLYSVSGDLLIEAMQEQLTQKTLDFSELPKGIYLLKVQLADHSETHRIVK